MNVREIFLFFTMFLNKKKQWAGYFPFLDLLSAFTRKVDYSGIRVYLSCLPFFTDILPSIGMTRGCPNVHYSTKSGSKRKEMVQKGSPRVLTSQEHL